MVPVVLRAQMNALGLLQISCVTADTQQSWPLEFNMREHVEGVAGAAGAGRRREPNAPIEPNASADTRETARWQIGTAFTQAASNSKKNKLNRRHDPQEPRLGSAKSQWNASLLRALACARAASGRQATLGGPRRD